MMKRHVMVVDGIPDPEKPSGRPSAIGRMAYDALIDGHTRRVGPYTPGSAHSLASRARKRYPDVTIKVRTVAGEGTFIYVGPRVD